MTTQQAETTGTATQAPTVNGVIMVAKIKQGQVEALRSLLQDNVWQLTSPTGNLNTVGTVHFARFAVHGDNFIFASYFDGDLEDYLDDFFSFDQGETFDLIFRHCEDSPGPHDREKYKDFWKSHAIEEIARYSYYPGVTCKEIEKALRIRNNMEAVLEDFE